MIVDRLRVRGFADGVALGGGEAVSGVVVLIVVLATGEGGAVGAAAEVGVFELAEGIVVPGPSGAVRLAGGGALVGVVVGVAVGGGEAG